MKIWLKKGMEMFKTHHVICSCLTADHDIRFMKDTSDGEVWIEVQLNPYKTFVQRIVAGVKYIFGYNSRFGHWDCTVLTPKETDKLLKFLKEDKEIIYAPI